MVEKSRRRTGHCRNGVIPFEYAGFANSLVGTNGTITDSSLAAGVLRVLQYYGFDTAFLGTDLRTSDKVVVPPSSCVYFMRWNTQIRIQDTGSTDGATKECNVGDAQTVDAAV
ncbi:hypothetical protein AAVH_28813 [Aphelenchoides avenae]|nr:hypothetical protein AAVH_28813 [Aphelenchus avenae]